jgi:hypothetical protein
MGRAAPDIPDDMRVLHGRFARWRKSHTGRLPIPEPLWAAELEHLGVGFVSLTDALDLTRAAHVTRRVRGA